MACKPRYSNIFCTKGNGHDGVVSINALLDHLGLLWGLGPAVERSTAYRAIDDLVADGVLEEVTGKQRNKEYRATEIFDILDRPPQTY